MFGDVKGCIISNNPNSPIIPSSIPCSTTCGQNRMIQNRDGQKIVGGTDAAEGEIGWQVRFDVYT